MKPLISLTLAVLLAQPLAAQERTRDTARSHPKSLQRIWIDGQDMTERFLPLMQRRARLGIVVKMLDAQETDSLGAFVQSVTPGGPSAKAGIRSGDIITKLDGNSVLTTPGRRLAEEESAPGVRLIELAAKLDPNDTVQVEFLRGDARRTVSVVTGDEGLMAFEGNRFYFRYPEGESRERIQLPPGVRVEPFELGPDFSMLERRPSVAMAFGGGALADLELAPINPDLGSYFGTTEGVLVTRAPSNHALGLKGGDVILSVDGRKPQSAGSLLRILRSYDDDETVKLEILRQKQRQTLSGKLGRARD
ncbi:MAG TPA: PDZ domain-containing protein [Gemmatimonadales bacterium]